MDQMGMRALHGVSFFCSLMLFSFFLTEWRKDTGDEAFIMRLFNIINELKLFKLNLTFWGDRIYSLTDSSCIFLSENNIDWYFVTWCIACYMCFVLFGIKTNLLYAEGGFSVFSKFPLSLFHCQLPYAI